MRRLVCLKHMKHIHNNMAGLVIIIFVCQAESQVRCLVRRFLAGNLGSLGIIESRLVALQEMEMKAEEKGLTIGMARGVLTRGGVILINYMRFDS